MTLTQHIYFEYARHELRDTARSLNVATDSLMCRNYCYHNFSSKHNDKICRSDNSNLCNGNDNENDNDNDNDTKRYLLPSDIQFMYKGLE